MKFNNPFKTTWLGRIYFLIGAPGAFAVAMFAMEYRDDNLTYFVSLILWLCCVMVGYTGWSKENEKYEAKKDEESQ